MRARRQDSNHAEIRKAFRDRGCTVLDLFTLAKALDILVGFNGKMAICEIKDGSLPPSARRLTPDEQDFFDNWLGFAVVVIDIADVDAVVAVLSE